MFGMRVWTALGELKHLNGTPSPTGVPMGSRRIALLRSGRRYGGITRLITPWDIGELTQPFVFLCHSELAPGAKTVVGAQPGIGTLTLVLSGVLVFEEAQGNKGMVVAGARSYGMPVGAPPTSRSAQSNCGLNYRRSPRAQSQRASASRRMKCGRRGRSGLSWGKSVVRAAASARVRRTSTTSMFGSRTANVGATRHPKDTMSPGSQSTAGACDWRTDASCGSKSRSSSAHGA
jgi:hypothetical protein